MVAERAGVGTTSVSRVFSEHSDVSQKMRETVLQAALEVGYETDLLARALRNGRSRTIGIVVGDLLNPFLAEIVAGVSERLREAGYAVLLASSLNDVERDVESVRVLLQRRVDGLILALADERNAELHALIQNAELPVVLLDRELPIEGVSAVIADHRTGIENVVSHLVGRGHTSIGAILGSTRTRPSRERKIGFEDAVKDKGLDSDRQRIHVGELTEVYGYKATKSILSEPFPPTALVCGGNQIATGALRAIDDLGLSIPSSVSIIACDDVPLTRLYRPHITVLARDAYAMGEAAASMLLASLTSTEVPDEPRCTTVPTQLIIRDSVGTVLK